MSMLSNLLNKENNKSNEYDLLFGGQSFYELNMVKNELNLDKDFVVLDLKKCELSNCMK